MSLLGAAVIDTNIWLDWLVFDDPSVIPLRCSDLLIYASSSMRAELADVLTRSRFGLADEQQQACLATFDARISVCEQPGASVTRLRCSDTDDQKFLELAIACRAPLLLTKDKALLSLARHARRMHRLQILTASAWADGTARVSNVR